VFRPIGNQAVPVLYMRPHSTRTVPGPGALCRRGRGSGAISSLQKRLSGSAKYNVIRWGLDCSPAWDNPKAETGLRRLSAPTHGSPATLQRRPSGARRPATETRRTRTSCRAGQSRKGGKASLWRPPGAAAVALAPPQNRRESPHPYETLPPDIALQGHHDDSPLTPVLRVDLGFCRTLGPSARPAKNASRHSARVAPVTPYLRLVDSRSVPRSSSRTTLALRWAERAAFAVAPDFRARSGRPPGRWSGPGNRRIRVGHLSILASRIRVRRNRAAGDKHGGHPAPHSRPRPGLQDQIALRKKWTTFRPPCSV
jgi:hypothetical protein